MYQISPQKPVELPPKYYLEYFTFLLDFVQRLYGHILNDDELAFIQQFTMLSADAQCLYVRFSNRAGLFFRTDKLVYHEITDISAALYELTDKGFIEPLDHSHQHFAPAIVNLFTKDEWLKLAPPTDLSLKPLKKPDLIRFLLYQFPFETLIQNINNTEPVIKVNGEVEVMMFKFLFFGNRHADMTEFVVRDLGKINFEQYRDDSYTARFDSRQEADDKLMVSLTAEDFYILQNSNQPPEEIFDWFMNWQVSVKNLSAVAQPSWVKLVNKVGAHLERQKLSEQALIVYQLTNQVPARERRVRLLHKLGLPDEAAALCDEIAQDPKNADERYFAIDFAAKMTSKQKNIKKSVTQFLQDSPQVFINIGFKYKVEQGVAEYLKSQGQMAVHAENLPWRALFGLVFWDIIYDANVQAIHHPLQRMPSDFYLPDFYVKRQDALKDRLETLQTNADFEAIVTQTFTEKFGTANVLIEWHEVMLELVVVIVKNLTVHQLRAILLEIALNLREHTRGFADLMAWDKHGLALVEVKSPTDHLSAQQLHWMYFMQNIGVNAYVLRVVWEQ
jgi:VRR-NUC domain